ncbi:MAG: hypothetical protein HY825_07120 [Acidobacteria bacterium]|nr:hypothetical protein [Acidobacteriota bacterium]
MKPFECVVLFLALAGAAAAQAPTDGIATAAGGASTYVFRPGVGLACTSPSSIYDTTHASNQGAEITSAANGPATSMADKIVLGGSARFVCEIAIEVFTLAATTPFDLTMSLYTDCTTSGAANSACGNGLGTLIPGSVVTVSGITPPGVLGTLFQVVFPYPNVDLSVDGDGAISVAVTASRSDVYWRINETPVVGSIPAGEPTTSYVERCGSTGSNNGCSRNFGVNNNFAITISAMATPVELQRLSVE